MHMRKRVDSLDSRVISFGTILTSKEFFTALKTICRNSLIAWNKVGPRKNKVLLGRVIENLKLGRLLELTQLAKLTLKET